MTTMTAAEAAPVYLQASAPAQGVPHTAHTPAQTDPVPVPAPAAVPAVPAVKPVRRWPLIFIGSPAAVAVWSGWVGLGGMCGFGVVHPLPGIIDSLKINTAITLPIGIEAYGMYALGAWLNPLTPASARTFARRSGIGSLALGMCGQVIYHLLAAARHASAPWPVVTLVSCLPVIALGLGTALAHLIHAGHAAPQPQQAAAAPAPATPAPAPVQEAAAPPVQAGPVRAQTGAEVRAELAAIRDQRAPVRPAPAREQRTDGRPDVDRAALVAELAGQIRDAVDAGEVWKPDYAALQARTGFGRSWHEKVVKEARDSVLEPAPAAVRTGEARTDQGEAARTGETRTVRETRTGSDPYEGTVLPGPYGAGSRTGELAGVA